MHTRKSLEELANRLDFLIVRSRAYAYRMVRFTKNAMVLAFRNGLEKGYFLGLQDAGEIMAQRQLPWRTGTPKGKRILAQEKENFTGKEDFIEVLHLADSGDYYDIHGEVVPHGAIAKWLPL